MDGADDHYGALGVEPEASAREIREAWRFALLAFHPDRFRDGPQRRRAEEVTKRANAAWEVLGDPGRRRAYDRDRARMAPGRRRERPLPCPSCATRCRTPDAGGHAVRLRCPACGDEFEAMVGARCVGRPRLVRGLLRMRYEAAFADGAGDVRTIAFRRLPPELALSEGEVFSVVFHPRRGHPVYAIVHGAGLDLGWRVR